MWWFVAGIFVGFIAGMFIAALLYVGGKDDEDCRN